MSLYLGDNLISGVAYPTEPTRNLGQIIESIVPLTDAGLHLLDGTLISGSGIYADFVTAIGDVYDNTTTVSSNISKVGTLTDNNGVLSGFSADNYALLPYVFSPTTSWEMVWKVTASDYSINSSRILGCYLESYKGCSLGFYGSKLCAWLGNADTSDSWNVGILTGTTTLVNNQTYYVKLEFTGTAYNLYLSTDGTTYNLEATLTSSAIISTQNLNAIGINRWNDTTGYNGILSGSIDLKESYININGSRWWTGALPSGFTDENQWQSAVTTYGVCGKFVYDSVNNTVRLPKVTGIIEGTTDVTALGDLVEAGLPNITGYVDAIGHYGDAGGSGALHVTKQINNSSISGSSQWGGSTVSIDASNSNSIYGNNSTVQPQTIKILYYIVVATTTKTEIEVDIDKVATDLNGKADVDLSNVANTSGFRKLVAIYNNGSSWYKVYREYNPTTGNYIGQWCEQGGTTGSISSGTKTSYLKTFTNTDYTFTMALLGSTQRDSAPAIVKATDGFTIYHNAGLNNGLGWSYIACGYIS